MNLKPDHDIRNFGDLHRELQKKAARELIAFGIFFLFFVCAIALNA
jgi:hypothetical protein